MHDKYSYEAGLMARCTTVMCIGRWRGIAGLCRWRRIPCRLSGTPVEADSRRKWPRLLDFAVEGEHPAVRQ